MRFRMTIKHNQPLTRKHILDAVKETQITRHKIAMEIGIHPNHLSRMLNGRKHITWPMILKLSCVLPLDMQRLLIIWSNEEGTTSDRVDINRLQEECK